MAFGERLQALRRGAGLTQEAFAQQLKVSRQSVSKWESCRGYPELEKIIYICNHYGVSMDELFQDEVPQSPAQTELSPQGLKPPPLKASLSNFFANLSPATSWWCGLGWRWSPCCSLSSPSPICRKERVTLCWKK